MELRVEAHVELRKFIEGIGSIVDKYKDEKTVTKELVIYLEENLEYYGRFIPEPYKKPNADKYALYPLYVATDDSFCIASAVWDVGQSTPIHDHGVWGVIGIVQGKEFEKQFVVEQNGEANSITQIGEFYLEEGDIKVCCSSDLDIHKVSCASQTPCIGIHIYGGNIGTIPRQVYDSYTGNIKSVVTPWDCAPLINELL